MCAGCRFPYCGFGNEEEWLLAYGFHLWWALHDRFDPGHWQGNILSGRASASACAWSPTGTRARHTTTRRRAAHFKQQKVSIWEGQQTQQTDRRFAILALAARLNSISEKCSRKSPQETVTVTFPNLKMSLYSSLLGPCRECSSPVGSLNRLRAMV